MNGSSRSKAAFNHQWSRACHGECGSALDAAAFDVCIGFIGQHAQRGGSQHLDRWLALGRQQRISVARNKPGVHAAGDELRMRRDATQQVEVAGDADHVGCRERTTQRPQRFVTRGSMADQLGQHGVVVDGNHVAGREAGIHTHVRGWLWCMEQRQASDGGREIALRVLGVYTDLDRMAVNADSVLCGRHGLACRDAQLPFDQVEAGDHLGHRMLDL